MDKAGVQAAFKAAGLTRVLGDLDRIARPSIRLTATKAADSELKVGMSRLGGSPDLPGGLEWPSWQKLPLSFIAQIRLKEAHSADVEGLLPPDGMLWFFYDAKQETYGSDPTQRDGWRVYYVEEAGLAHLELATSPKDLPSDSRFQACTLSFANEMTLPQEPALDLPNFDWSQAEQQSYEDLLSTFPTKEDHGATQHRMLGNPETLQDDMRQQCQLVSQGITDANDPRSAKALTGAMDWLLLLQVDTDDQAGMRWANTGLLYYWIKQADLQARHFDATWLVLQSE